MSHLEKLIADAVEALGIITDLECHEEAFFEAAAEAADYTALSAD